MKTGAAGSFWIALTKLSTTPVYYWYGSNELVSFNNFAAIQTNPHNHCIAMVDSDLKWVDRSCEDKNYYVCESDISQ